MIVRGVVIFVVTALTLGVGASVWLAVAINTTTSNHFTGPFAPQTLSAALTDTVFLMKGPNIQAICATILLLLAPLLASMVAKFATRESLPKIRIGCSCRLWLLRMLALVVSPLIVMATFAVIDLIVPQVSLANYQALPNATNGTNATNATALLNNATNATNITSNVPDADEAAAAALALLAADVPSWAVLVGAALIPFPLLPIFLAIESGYRGYLQSRVRTMFDGPRLPVYLCAALAPLTGLPLTLTGQLLGGSSGGENNVVAANATGTNDSSGQLQLGGNGRYMLAPYLGAISIALLQLLVGLCSGFLALADSSAVASALLVGSATSTTMVAAIGPSLVFPNRTVESLSPYYDALPLGALLPLWVLIAVIGLVLLPRWERAWRDPKEAYSSLPPKRPQPPAKADSCIGSDEPPKNLRGPRKVSSMSSSTATTDIDLEMVPPPASNDLGAAREVALPLSAVPLLSSASAIRLNLPPQPDSEPDMDTQPSRLKIQEPLPDAEPDGDAASSRAMTREQAREKLLAFYSEHNPEKMGDAEKILDKYAHNYPQMFANLRRKYARESTGGDRNSVQNNALRRARRSERRAGREMNQSSAPPAAYDAAHSSAASETVGMEAVVESRAAEELQPEQEPRSPSRRPPSPRQSTTLVPSPPEENRLPSPPSMPLARNVRRSPRGSFISRTNRQSANIGVEDGASSAPTVEDEADNVVREELEAMLGVERPASNPVLDADLRI